MKFRGDSVAFGAPGIPPKWTHGNKDGVGTAYSADSKVWFTLWRGVLTEVYYPLIDHPQVRDLQFLISDGRTFFHEEKRHLESRTVRLPGPTLGYRILNRAPDGQYSLEKEVISDPHLPVVLQRVKFRAARGSAEALTLYALCAPHLDVGGWGNSGYVVELPGRTLLAAERNGTWLAVGATTPFTRLSCGYVGSTDGWTDLAENFRMDFEFDRAPQGNIALTGAIDVAKDPEFTLALAFGRDLPGAVSALTQSLAVPFATQRARFVEQWKRVARHRRALEGHSGDGGNLFRTSYSLLLAHEDKTFPGACIASLSIPWGQAKGDEDRGGYHLVWTRDLVQTATGLLASGNPELPLRTLIYLAASQRPDGSFPQNFWLNAEPYWGGLQLDEVAFPILLAARLRREQALQEFDPWPMVRAAARFLLDQGPATGQERWEELGGISPSTVASNIAALVVAAEIAREKGESGVAAYFEEYADFLHDHVDSWTVTTQGTILASVPRHYVRIRPIPPGESYPEGPANSGTVRIANHPPEDPAEFPTGSIVDAGFLELVRYGIKRPDDPLVVDSLRVVDSALRVETPFGPVWRRYNHDGYGQRDDGGPFVGWGVGRAWPLLTGERAHYEVAAGGDVAPLVAAIEKFASTTGLLPEQVWDQADRADLHLRLGRPTTSAMPLVWAHAEYAKLLRSIEDGRVFDRFDSVEHRYSGRTPRPHSIEFWKPAYPTPVLGPSSILRVQQAAPFRIHWSVDNWRTVHDTEARPTGMGLWFQDFDSEIGSNDRFQFTFYWPDRDAWEGRDYSLVRIADDGSERDPFR